MFVVYENINVYVLCVVRNKGEILMVTISCNTVIGWSLIVDAQCTQEKKVSIICREETC